METLTEKEEIVKEMTEIMEDVHSIKVRHFEMYVEMQELKHRVAKLRMKIIKSNERN